MSSRKNKLIESAQKNIQKGQFDRAITEYEEIIRLDATDVRHRQRLAELLTKSGRKDEAIKEYHSLAKHYIDNIHYLKAIAVYKQIQKLEPANAETSLTLASLNEKQGLAGNAAAEYTSAIQIYEKNGENLKALKVLESMLALDPQNLAIRLRVAEKYFSTGNEDKSFAEFLSLAQTLKDLSDENGLNHVIERTSKIFPQRLASLRTAIADKAENGAKGSASAPAAAPVVSTPTPAAPAPRVSTPAPPAPVASTPAPSPKPVAPPSQEPAIKTAPVELQPPPGSRFPEEPYIAELAEDDLIEDILPITESAMEIKPAYEPAHDDFDWEEDIDFSEMETPQSQTLATPQEPDRLLPQDLESEEIHELEEIELVLELEDEPEPEVVTTASTPEEIPFSAGLEVHQDSVADLSRELSLFADELDFDLMTVDNAEASSSFDAFASYTKGDLDHEDSESHYSLGLAYKEMGLFEDAISEFKVASRSPERKIDCLILQGLCQRDSGDLFSAVALLQQIIQESEVTENQLLSIKYELALCHELSGKAVEAKKLFTEILMQRPDFGDTAARIAKIRG